MIQVNLIPDVKLELVKAQRHRNIVILVSMIVIAAAVGIFITIIMIVFVFQSLQISSLTKEIKIKQEKFMDIKDIQKTATISNQLAYIDSSHESKTISSRIFDLMNASSLQGTENSIAINGFVIDKENSQVSITAQTETAGYSAVEVYVKNLEAMKMYYIEASDDEIPNSLRDDKITSSKSEISDKVASDVNVTDLAYTDSADTGARVVSFKVVFTYNENFFSQKIDLLRLQGIENGNVTDSYQRLPESLFAEGSAVAEPKEDK